MHEESRYRWVQEATGGDACALQRLIVEYHPILHRRLARQARDLPPPAPEVEDVLQDAYIAAFRGIKECSFGAPAAFYAWLERIALNQFTDRQRASMRAKRDVRRAVELPSQRTTYAEFAHGFLVDHSTPSRVIARREAEAAVLTSLARLSDDQRDVVRLRFLEGLPVCEVAERLGRTDDAIHALCRRGLRSLRELMGSVSQYLSRP